MNQNETLSQSDNIKDKKSKCFLEVKNIKMYFGGVKALDDVSFSINEGETYCLMGENGSGKSTLIKIISGVYQPTDGEIILNGKSVKNLTPTQSIKAGIQIIYQDFSVFANLSVAENISLSNMFINKKKFINKKEMHKIAKDALERIGVDLPLDALVGDLPVAGKQIVAIARGLAQDVRLLVMDEPTTALTQKEINALYNIIDILKKKGIAIIFVSHKLEEVFAISQSIAILRNGKKVLDDAIENFDKNSLTYHMTGKEIPSVPYDYQPDKNNKTPIIKVENLTQENAFYDVSFEVLPKEILGITGQLGCGRTELAKALFGIGNCSGTVQLNGQEVQINSVIKAQKLGIGYVPEDRLSEGLFLGRSLSDNITVAGIDKLAKGIMINQEKLDSVSQSWIEQLDIAAENVQIPASNLSGGNQQRIVLAKWLQTKPRLLILNCPTVGVDVGSKSQIHEVIKQLAKKGIGIIVISDDIGEILSLCNRVLLMKNGHVINNIQSNEISVDELELQVISEDVGGDAK